MMTCLSTAKGKVVALLVFYIPFICALFFNFFDGKEYESPIGGCCIPMEGVVIAGYGLFTVWILGPALLAVLFYRLFRKFAQ